MSILKTFRNLKFSFFILILLIGFISYALFNSSLDLKKMNLIAVIEKKVSQSLQYNTNNGQTGIQMLKEHQLSLLSDLESALALHAQDYLQHFFIQSKTTSAALKNLQTSILSANAVVLKYYMTHESVFLEQFEHFKEELSSKRIHYKNALINDFEKKNKIILYTSLIALFYVLIIFLWYSRRLTVIYKDIKRILSIEEDDRNKSYSTHEFTAIKRRLERRPLASGGKNLLDPLTGLLSEKGLLTEYVQRGTNNANEYVFVTVFDIDNYKEVAQKYGKEVTDMVLKKFAFILNLEKKPSDVVGRMGEDQFIMIATRSNQQEAFSTVEAIRLSFEKNKFKSLDGKISMTVSGGFTQKDKHEKIESAIGTANSLVKKSKIHGKNIIAKKQGFGNNLNDRM